MGFFAAGVVIAGWIVYRRLRKWQDPNWSREKSAGSRFGWSKRGSGGF